MEHLEAISEINWNFSDETEVIMSQLLGAYPCMNEPDQEINLGIQPMLWSDQDGSSYNLINNLSSFWPGTGDTASTSSFFPPHPEFQSYQQMTASMDYLTPEGQMTGSSLVVDDLILLEDDENELKDNGTSNTPETIVVPKHSSLAKRKNLELKDGIPTKSPKKKAQASMQVQKNWKNASAKESKKSAVSGEVLSNVSCSSEGESNISQELNEPGSSSAKGKIRASCRSATDPQSLYARKRRERINERLRILQNLVPNGTKVDISTMLEEAVQYVKFLQLQIKLLSSDDLWMYAPLAYNGMDLGLDLNILLRQP